VRKKGANLCRQNCDPLDENNDFIAGVESQTFSAKGPFLTGWLHMYLFMIGLRGVGDSLQGFTPHDPIVGEMGHPPLLAVVGKESPLPSHAQVFGSVQN
jgi:hypothetical protein